MNIRNYAISFQKHFLLATTFLMLSVTTNAQNLDDPVIFTKINRWVSSTKIYYLNSLRITVHDGEDVQFITEDHRDHKPVWSREGDMITFFRSTGETDVKPFNQWRTNICVVNSDGTGFKELTDAENPNFNPTWTRDGSNKIIFSRMSKSTFGNNTIHWISTDAQMNDASQISNPNNAEWAESGLKDGRIFIYRIHRAMYILNYITPFYTWPYTQSYFLLDPKATKYYPVKRQNKYPTHKLSLSPSETKVVYMKDLDGKLETYNDAVIAYADFDLKDLVVKNEVVISAENSDHIDMYPRWSSDEKYIVFSSSRGNGHMWNMEQYIYDLDTGKTHLISDGNFSVDMYPCFEGVPK
jgi:Tol biopolymer transport system component